MYEQKPVIFSDWLSSLQTRYGGKTAVVCGEDTIGFSQLENAARCCALDLIKRGVKKGDTVVLMAANGVDWLVSFFGIILTGGVAALVNYGLNGQDVATVSTLVGAKWAILGLDQRFGVQPEVVAKVLSDSGIPTANILSCRGLYADAARSAAECGDQDLAERPQPRDTQVILFTTGSTALPKAVQLSSRAILSNVYGILDILGKDLGDVCCPALPLFHSFGMITMLFSLEHGCTVCLPRDITPETVLELIARRDVDTVYSVATIFRMLMELPAFKEVARGKIRTCLWASSWMSPADRRLLHEMLGEVCLLPCYGLSECAAGVTISGSHVPAQQREASVGQAIPNLDMRIWEAHRGFLPRGEMGEVVIKGPCLMNGYLGVPREAQPIDQDGWLHTGDLGHISEDGLLHLDGRIKNLIKRAGENIAPAEIEAALLEEPSIREAVVVGCPHSLLGESVEACVVLRFGELNERRLRTSLRKKLSPHKVPDHIIALPAIPLKTNGKVDYLRLKEMTAEKLDGGNG